MRIIILYLIFQCITITSFAQNLKKQSKNNADSNEYTFMSGWPIFSGLFGGKNFGLRNVLILGLDAGYGKAFNKVLVGTKLSYVNTHIQGLKGSNQSEWSLYAEYHFKPGKKVTPLLGFRTYLYLFQYWPEHPDYQFFNDPLDGKSRTRIMPGIYPYAGFDFLLKKKFHLVFGFGYDYKFTKKSGRIPILGKQGTDFYLDFRIPIRKKK